MSTGASAPKSSILGNLAKARAASVEASGLVKPGASIDSPKSEIVTGMASTASMAAKSIGVSTLPPIDATRPRKTKESQVLFRSAKPNLGFHLANVRVGFTHGWLLTEDTKIISYLRDEKNATHFHVVEVKEEIKK